jgi:hypothetical protein
MLAWQATGKHNLTIPGKQIDLLANLGYNAGKKGKLWTI